MSRQRVPDDPKALLPLLRTRGIDQPLVPVVPDDPAAKLAAMSPGGMSLLDAFDMVVAAAAVPAEPPDVVRVSTAMTLVDFECAHGALPLDDPKPKGCACWTPARMAALSRYSP
ncbi:MAG TPA: hypothetical protein VIS51_10075 [Solirubrobacterales bacterium]